jgi:2-oxoglutarate ferredoxin oxidoreductase subunit gamma
VSDKTEVRLAGFGGQGIVLAGNILGKAATLFEGKNAVFTQSYGPEARGGACTADVVISTGRINYPKVIAPEVLVLMSEDAKHTYGHIFAKGAMVLTDQDLVRLDEAPAGCTLRRVPATRLAEELGRSIVANIVMLGFLTAVTGVVTEDSMRQAILASIPKGTEDLNVKAFEAGLAHGQKEAAP